MNVYVRELVSALAQAGVDCRVYVRRWRDDLPDEVAVEPGFRVVHVAAGPSTCPRRSCRRSSTTWTDGRARPHHRDRRHRRHPRQLLAVGAGRPRASSTASTCRWCRPSTRWPGSRPRPATPSRSAGSTPRPRSSPAPTPSSPRARPRPTQLERFYGARPDRIEIVPPGRRPRLLLARRPAGGPHALGLALRRAGAAVRRAHPAPQGPRRGRRRAGRSCPSDDAVLVAVGGPSGAAGEAELARVHELAADLGVEDRIRYVPPQPHHLLSTYYRAADVCVVPSRSESFGLVALEAAACGTPGRGRRGRRARHPRRGRQHRPAGRGPRPGRLRRRHRRPAGRSRTRPARWARPPPPGPAATPGPRRPPACAASTPTSPSASWSTAPDSRIGGRRIAADGISSDRVRSAMDRRTAAELDEIEGRIDGWLAEQLADQPGGGRHRPRRERRAPLVRAAAGRAEGHLHGLVHPAPADPPLRDLRDAGARGELRGSSTSTCCAAT